MPSRENHTFTYPEIIKAASLIPYHAQDILLRALYTNRANSSQDNPNNLKDLGPFRDPLLDTSGDVVGFYPREYYPLDNFAPFQVVWLGRRWATSEYAYQSAKFFETAPEVAEAIADCFSPHDALKMAMANKDKVQPNWDEVKVPIMETICRAKLLQNQYIKDKLELTGDIPIVEDSPKDSFWGWGPDRQGRNELGKIWEKLREELRSGVLDQETN